jgi:hypothetical protein
MINHENIGQFNQLYCIINFLIDELIQSTIDPNEMKKLLYKFLHDVNQQVIMVVRCPPSFIKKTRLNIVYLSGDRFIFMLYQMIYQLFLDIFREKVAKSERHD